MRGLHFLARLGTEFQLWPRDVAQFGALESGAVVERMAACFADRGGRSFGGFSTPGLGWIGCDLYGSGQVHRLVCRPILDLGWGLAVGLGRVAAGSIGAFGGFNPL